jgi:hypothetical protein
MNTQFGFHGENVSQFDAISSPNILDGGKGLKTPDIFATTGGLK